VGLASALVHRDPRLAAKLSPDDHGHILVQAANAEVGQQGGDRPMLETRLERLLPVGYFHVVFTLPALLSPLVLHDHRLL
jgi:hypothetical protein